MASLDKFREDIIRWNRASGSIYKTLRLVSTDYNGRKLRVVVTNNGASANLTGSTLRLYWKTKIKINGGKSGFNNFTPIDITRGEFSLLYSKEMLSNIGMLSAWLYLIDSEGFVTSQKFDISISRGIDEDAIMSTNDYSALQEALIAVQNMGGGSGGTGIKGDDGYTPVKGVDYFDGEDGVDGKSSYLWFMYSQNPNGSPMVESSTNAKYIGIAKNETGIKPTSYLSYQWSLIKGDKGDKGDTGETGSVEVLTKAHVETALGFSPLPTESGNIKTYVETTSSPTVSGTTVLNLLLANVFEVTLSQATTFSIINPDARTSIAQSFTLIIDIGTTAGTLTFPANVKWQGGEIPDMTVANKTYILTFMTVDNGTVWYGMLGGEF